MTGKEQVIRALYQAAEVQDSQEFASLFTDDGVFNDKSACVKYRGKELGRLVISASIFQYGVHGVFERHWWRSFSKF
jgi:hypothetical protein